MGSEAGFAIFTCANAGFFSAVFVFTGVGFFFGASDFCRLDVLATGGTVAGTDSGRICLVIKALGDTLSLCSFSVPVADK